MSDRSDVIARKRHVCGICNQAIMPKERYLRLNIKPWDHPNNDGYASYCFCLFCHNMRDRHFYNERDMDDVGQGIKAKFHKLTESILGTAKPPLEDHLSASLDG